VTEFPTSYRTPATNGKTKFQGSDIQARLQDETTEAPELDPETGKPLGPVTREQLTRPGGLDIDGLEDPKVQQPQITGRVL
jgi:hypothetical protein